jgi:hypothetical protein
MKTITTGALEVALSFNCIEIEGSVRIEELREKKFEYLQKYPFTLQQDKILWK